MHMLETIHMQRPSVVGIVFSYPFFLFLPCLSSNLLKLTFDKPCKCYSWCWKFSFCLFQWTLVHVIFYFWLRLQNGWLVFFESAGVCRITIFFMGRKSVPKLRKDLASSLFSASWEDAHKVRQICHGICRKAAKDVKTRLEGVQYILLHMTLRAATVRTFDLSWRVS